MMSKTTVRRSFSRSLLFFLPTTLLISVASCDAPDPSGPGDQDILFKGKPSGDPDPEIVVSGFAPDVAEPGLRFKLTVTGDGFQDGATVFLGRNGKTVSTITTHSTSVQGPTLLVGDIEIGLDAELGDYQVVVSFRRGKGIGTESFKVKPLYSVEVTELGSLNGAKRVIASAIAGTHIVGVSSVGLWHMTLGGSPTLLKCDGVGTAGCDWGAGNGARSIDVNSDGLIVSAATKIDGLNQATYWTSAGLSNIDLPSPPGSVVSNANGVSATGYVAGSAILGEILPDNQEALLWKIDAAGSVTAARNLHVETFNALGGAWSAAHDVNDFGHVVGSAESFGAFFWDDGEPVALPGEGDVWPTAINSFAADNLRVAGSFSNLPGSPSARGVVWTVQGGAVTGTEDLPPLIRYEEFWFALDINDAGDVVGTGQKLNSGNTGRESLVHALLWTRDEATGAYTVVDLGPGRASAIENVSLQDSGTTRVVGWIESKKGGATPVMWTVRKLN